MRIEGLHALVTGASSGIGEAVAKALHARGAKVTVVARRQANLDALEATLKSRIAVVAHDLSTDGAVDHIVSRAVAAHGPIDIMVNNAGMMVGGPLASLSPEDGQRLLRVNLNVPLEFCHKVSPDMSPGRAAIVNIASVAAFAPLPGFFYYNASKAGLGMASEALSIELAPSKIAVCTVYPGPVKTEMGHQGNDVFVPSPSQKAQIWGTTTTLAKKIVRGIEKGTTRIIYPQVYAVPFRFPNATMGAIRLFRPRLVGE